jgi:hypothetical protein
MPETVFFLDTDVILQCKNLEELSWSDVTPADTIRVILPWIVCAQLDRLKNDGNSRRAKRARKASSKCDEILESEGQRVLIRQSGPKLTLELTPSRKPKQTDFPDLDLSYDDDMLVAETISFSRANPSLDVRLLTADSGPKMTAKRQGLPYTSVPPEGWRLPPENDPRDKEIAKLREQNERLSSEYARIEVHLKTEDGERPDKIAIVLPRYQPLEQQQVVDIVESALARFPKRTAPGQSYGPNQLALMHPAIRQVYDREYASWEHDLRAFLLGLHENPYAFHYHGGGKPSSDLFYTCREFSHHREPENLSFILMPHDDMNPASNGSVECKVTARNLACAALENSGIAITFADKDTLPLAERLIEEITLD